MPASAVGTSVVDSVGSQLQLRGVNLGGWLHREGYLFGTTPLVSQSMLAQRLAALVGQDSAATWLGQLQDTWITQSDIAAIAQAGFNTVRVPINYRLLEDDSAPDVYKDSGWVYIDNLLNWCDASNLYVVLDLHAAPGGQSSYPTCDPMPPSLWTTPPDQTRTANLWAAIAARYSTRECVIGYDLLNEPDPPDGATLVAVYQQIIAAIRAVDTAHMLILEGKILGGDLSPLSHPLDSNQCLSIHVYQLGKISDGSQLVLNAAEMFARSANCPLFIGEFGENTLTWTSSTLPLFKQNGIAGWCYWTWKRVQLSNPNPVEIVTTPKWKLLAGWLSLTNAPSLNAAYAQAAMSEFLSSLTAAQTNQTLMQQLLS